MERTKTYTEEQLLAGLIARQRQAFDYLYANYSAALLGVIIRVVNDRGTGEDVLQEVFVKIWNNIDKYDSSKSGLFAWMVSIARNHAIDKMRAKGHHTKWEVQPGEPKEDTGGASEIYTDGIGMQKLMKNLEETEKEIIDILFFKGYTQSEAAEELNIPLGTVKSRARRAISQLRKYFG